MSSVPSFHGVYSPHSVKGVAAKRTFPAYTSSRGVLGMSGGKKTKLGGTESQSWRSLGLTFLKAKHPLKTTHCVAVDTGISPHTIDKWFNGTSKPGWHHTMMLIGAYGPEFLSAVCPSCRVWIEPSRKLEEFRELQAQRVQLNQQIKDLGYESDDETLSVQVGDVSGRVSVIQNSKGAKSK